MKKIIILFFILYAGIGLSGCAHTKNWSYSEDERTFIGQESKIKINKAEKISLENNRDAIRIYFDVTNLSSKDADAYYFLLGEIDSLYQDSIKLDTVTILGNDANAKFNAVNVNIPTHKTRTAFVDYKVDNLKSDVKINFTNEIGGDKLATYALKTTNLNPAAIDSINF